MKNRWMDSEGKVYIYFSQEQIAGLMGCGVKKVRCLLKELDDRKGIGLITRVRQGLGNPDRIYVKKCVSPERFKENFRTGQNDFSGKVQMTDADRCKLPGNDISVFITVILYGRMIEIYLYSSIGAIPFATMSNREWGQIGSNYLRGLFALAFQGFFIMVCVGIYSVLVANIQVSDNVHTALLSVMAYTVVLCFSLMKTANFSKSVFNTH